MDRRSLPPSTDRRPFGLIGMVVLVAGVESYLASRSVDFMGDAAHAWRWGAKAAARDALKSEILCFGDSLVKFGVAPRVVEGRSGRSMWNLAVTGGRPVNSYFLLRRALNAGARPSALVLDAELLSADPYETPHLWPELATPPEIIEMAWVGRNPGFLAHYALAWVFPSVRGRYEIRSHILAAARGEASNLRNAANLSNRNWKANRGAFIFPSTHQLSAASAYGFDSSSPDVPVPGRWSAHPVNAVYLDKFLDLAAKRDIPVFWLFPPHYRMQERFFDRPNWNGSHRKFARERLDRYPNLVVIDGNRANYDRAVVMDVSHLNRNGAVAYSIALGDILRDRLSGTSATSPRWIELPAYREPPAEAPVEDMAQSIIEITKRR